MTFEDEARKDLNAAFEQSAEQVRQLFDRGSDPTAEEMISTLRELVTAASNNTVRLAAVVDRLWDSEGVTESRWRLVEKRRGEIPA